LFPNRDIYLWGLKGVDLLIEQLYSKRQNNGREIADLITKIRRKIYSR
jgi:hypothetical protein